MGSVVADVPPKTVNIDVFFIPAPHNASEGKKEGEKEKKGELDKEKRAEDRQEKYAGEVFKKNGWATMRKWNDI